MIDEFDVTNLGFDLTLTTHRWALLDQSTTTPNFDTNAVWSATGEVTGTNWVTPGVLFSAAGAGATSLAPTLTISPAGTMMWDMNDISVASTTLTGAYAIRAYADALTTPIADALILLINFGAAYATSNGTFAVQFAATGVGTVDWTP
jgi:hypothetical protein